MVTRRKDVQAVASRAVDCRPAEGRRPLHERSGKRRAARIERAHGRRRNPKVQRLRRRALACGAERRHLPPVEAGVEGHRQREFGAGHARVEDGISRRGTDGEAIAGRPRHGRPAEQRCSVRRGRVELAGAAGRDRHRCGERYLEMKDVRGGAFAGSSEGRHAPPVRAAAERRKGERGRGDAGVRVHRHAGGGEDIEAVTGGTCDRRPVERQRREREHRPRRGRGSGRERGRRRGRVIADDRAGSESIVERRAGGAREAYVERLVRLDQHVVRDRDGDALADLSRLERQRSAGTRIVLPLRGGPVLGRVSDRHRDVGGVDVRHGEGGRAGVLVHRDVVDRQRPADAARAGVDDRLDLRARQPVVVDARLVRESLIGLREAAERIGADGEGRTARAAHRRRAETELDAVLVEEDVRRRVHDGDVLPLVGRHGRRLPDAGAGEDAEARRPGLDVHAAVVAAVIGAQDGLARREVDARRKDPRFPRRRRAGRRLNVERRGDVVVHAVQRERLPHASGGERRSVPQGSVAGALNVLRVARRRPPREEIAGIGRATLRDGRRTGRGENDEQPETDTHPQQCVHGDLRVVQSATDGDRSKYRTTSVNSRGRCGERRRASISDCHGIAKFWNPSR